MINKECFDGPLWLDLVSGDRAQPSMADNKRFIRNYLLINDQSYTDPPQKKKKHIYGSNWYVSFYLNMRIFLDQIQHWIQKNYDILENVPLAQINTCLCFIII